jgi:hypothetical protein
MKNKIKVPLIFVAGLVVGATATFLILGRTSFLRYRDFVIQSAREQTFIASQLRANRQRELGARAEANLPTIVLAIHNDRDLQAAPGAPQVLKEIRDFYEMNSLPIPAEISGILSTVPRSH